MEKVKAAFMYDFDGTLAAGNAQEYYFIPEIIKNTKEEFWNKVNSFGKDKNMDPMLAVMYVMYEESRKRNYPLNKAQMLKQGKKIKFFEGVLSWFERINKYADSIGIEVQHFIISSGLKEIMEGTKIAKNFKKIFGSCFLYDENNNILWPAHAINYTTKTQYIYRIRKNLIDDLNDPKGINEFSPTKSNFITFDRMVYFGDGETDIPCMVIVESNGGNAVCVYDPASEKAKNSAKRLYLDKRAKYIAPADYSKGSEIEQLIKGILSKIASYIEI